MLSSGDWYVRSCIGLCLHAPLSQSFRRLSFLVLLSVACTASQRLGYFFRLQTLFALLSKQQEYKSLHQHKSSKLTDERIRLLESVGFTWKAPRGARRKHPMGGESAATLTVCSPIAQSSSSLSKEMPQGMEATSCSISSVRRNPSHLLDETCKAAHNDSTFSNPDREQRRKTHSNSTPNTADVGGTELDRQLLTTIPLRIAYHSPRHRWHPSVLATRSATTSCKFTQIVGIFVTCCCFPVLFF